MLNAGEVLLPTSAHPAIGNAQEHSPQSRVGQRLRLAGNRIEVTVRDPADLPRAAALISRVTGSSPRADADSRRLDAPALDRVSVLTELAPALHDAGLAVEDITLRRPTLDEVFLHPTGHRAGSVRSGKETAA